MGSEMCIRDRIPIEFTRSDRYQPRVIDRSGPTPILPHCPRVPGLPALSREEYDSPEHQFLLGRRALLQILQLCQDLQRQQSLTRHNALCYYGTHPLRHILIHDAPSQRNPRCLAYEIQRESPYGYTYITFDGYRRNPRTTAQATTPRSTSPQTFFKKKIVLFVTSWRTMTTLASMKKNIRHHHYRTNISTYVTSTLSSRTPSTTRMNTTTSSRRL